MKSWVKLAIGVSVVALGGLGGAWYVISGNLVTGVKQAIDQLNTASGEHQPTFTVEYASLRRAPFPTIGARLTDIHAQLKAPDKKVAVVWKGKGAMDLTSMPWRNAYQLRADSVIDTEITAGDEVFDLHTQGAPVVMQVTASDRAAFEALARIQLKDPETTKKALEGIAQATLTTGEVRIAGGDDTLYSHQAMVLGITRTQDEAMRDVAVIIELKDSLTSPAYQTMVTSLSEALGGGMPFSDIETPFAAARAGKQTVDIAAHLALPKAGLTQSSPVAVEFSRFEVKNDLYHLQFPLSIRQQVVEGNRVIKAALQGSYQLTPAGGKEMETYGLPFIAQFGGFLYDDAGQERDKTEVNQQLAAILPNLSTLGPVTLTMDVDANLAASAASPAEETDTGGSQYTLNQFEFSHARWGLDAKGMITEPGGDEGINADITLHCLKCKTLMADGFATARAVQTMQNSREPERVQWRVDESTEKQVSELLAEIGKKDAATGDITLSLTTPDEGNILVNGKSLAEVMPKIMAIVAPELAAQMPAAVMGEPPAE